MSASQRESLKDRRNFFDGGLKLGEGRMVSALEGATLDELPEVAIALPLNLIALDPYSIIP
jgi:hypothetical protein